MIIAKCPVRVSLVGGSSDLQEFLEHNGSGSVISFPCNLYTYITVHENHRKKYIVNCTNPEEVSSWHDIKNDIVRVVFEEFKPKKHLTVSFNSDIFSVGSGMAASSSYLIAMIKAMCVLQGREMTDFDICKLALTLERKFNPLTGQQDPYGCGMSGFKRIYFSKDDDPSFEYLDSSFLEKFDMYLLYTGQTRGSTNILKSIDIKKLRGIVDLVNVMHQSVLEYDDGTFFEIIAEGWEKKKLSSDLILGNDDLLSVDTLLSESENVFAHKLCGAGGGGHFLIFCKKNSPLPELPKPLNKIATKITISLDGLSSLVI